MWTKRTERSTILGANWRLANTKSFKLQEFLTRVTFRLWIATPRKQPGRRMRVRKRRGRRERGAYSYHIIRVYAPVTKVLNTTISRNISTAVWIQCQCTWYKNYIIFRIIVCSVVLYQVCFAWDWNYRPSVHTWDRSWDRSDRSWSRLI